MAGTYQIVKLWSGDLFKISIYFDSVPVAHPFCGSLSNVYDEKKNQQNILVDYFYRYWYCLEKG